MSGERSLAIEVEQLRAFPLALQRRLLRATSLRLGVSLDFAQTARVLSLLDGPVGSTPRREQLSEGLRAERTPRELRLVLTPTALSGDAQPPVEIPVPGSGAGFGVRIAVTPAGDALALPPATLRAAAPADRVRLRHSGGAPKRIKEVLERIGIPAPDRAGWPVLSWKGEIVWLRGAALEPTPLSRQLTIQADEMAPSADVPSADALSTTPDEAL